MAIILDCPEPIEILLQTLVKQWGLTDITLARALMNGSSDALLTPYQPTAERPFHPDSLTVEDLEKELLIPREERYRDPSGSCTALVSLARADGSEWKHLTLVDLNSEIHPSGEKAAIQKAIQAIQDSSIGGLDEKGVLVDSGHGFHYYGSALRTEPEWMEWMRKIRNNPAVGLTYATYRLNAGFTSLRIGTHPRRHSVKPVVVAYWRQSVNC